VHGNWRKLTWYGVWYSAFETGTLISKINRTFPGNERTVAIHEPFLRTWFFQNRIEAVLPVTLAAGGAAASVYVGHQVGGYVESARGSQTAGVAAGTLAGAGTGALVGAAIGSIVPGIGTAIGAGVGGVVGGIGGLIGSLW